MRVPSHDKTQRGVDLITKTKTIMKELIDILTNEDKSFDFPWWVYVFVAPVVLILMCGMAGSLA